MTAKKIIVGYDRSAESKNAARWALDEAARTGSVVQFFYAYEWPIWMPAASMVPVTAVWPDGETDRAITGSLDEAVATARTTHPGVRTEISIVHAVAALTLVDRSTSAALIVLGSRGHSGVTGLLGSLSTAVSAHAHCPVIVVRGDAAATAPIVAGVDDSPAGDSVLAFAFDQATLRGAALRLISAGPGSASPDNARAEAEKPWRATARQTVTELVDGWKNKFPQVAATHEVVADHPANALTLASTTAQLLVVGSRGRGALQAMVLGSVSQHLLRHSACTVAVVHEAPAS